MENVYVEGLPLPNQLVEMLSSGRWLVPEKKDLIKQLGIEEAEDLVFFNLTEMESNTAQLRKLALDEHSDYMALVSDSFETPPTGYLDATKALVIAATYGDEALCLDYSDSNDPRVVATHDSDHKMRWVVVAESFEKLVDFLEL